MTAGTVFHWPDGRSVTVLTSCPPGTAWSSNPTSDDAPGLRSIGASHDANHDGYIIVAIAGTRFGRPYYEGQVPVALEVWPYAVPPGATVILP